MSMSPRAYRGVAGAVVLFVLVQVGALVLVPSFVAGGYQPVENPQDPTNSAVYVGAILVATVMMLLAFRWGLDELIRYLVVGISGLLAWYVFSALASPVAAVALAATVPVALLVHPEWYVIDAAGVLMGAGAAGLFGISFGLLPALLLLSALAVYDAVSVYGTEHMLSLAEGVMDLRIPVVLVVPLSLSYSLLADDFSGAAGVHDDKDEEEDEKKAETGGTDGAQNDPEPEPELEPEPEPEREPNPGDSEANPNGGAAGRSADGEPDADGNADAGADPADRDAFFIGLGDAVIPAVLVASAANFSPAAGFGLPVVGLNLPALAAMVGTLIGLLVLLRWVFRGRAHAGLPLLNGGAIAGYLLGSLAAGVPLVAALGLSPFV